MSQAPPLGPEGQPGSAGPSTGLEPPTGRRRVRGPTLFVLGLLMAVAVAAIARTCLAPA
jgi:hypothetical protein